MATKIGTQKISNSYRGLRFKISKSDIENGQPNDPCACAAALALKRSTGARMVWVFRDVTYIDRVNTLLRYHTTPALRLETIIFDRQGQFFPGEYDLAPAPLVEKTKTNSKSSSSSKKRGSKGGYRLIPNVRPTASQSLARA